MTNRYWQEFRCAGCKKLLAVLHIYTGRIAIKCYSCNHLNEKNFLKLKTVDVKREEKEYNPSKLVIQKGGDK